MSGRSSQERQRTQPNAEASRTSTRSTGSRTSIDESVIERRVKKAGMEVVSRGALSNGHGTKFTLLGGGIVTVYGSGKCVIQGVLSDANRKALEHAFRPRERR